MGRIVFTFLDGVHSQVAYLENNLKGKPPDFISENTTMPYMTREFSVVSNFLSELSWLWSV